MNRIKTRKALSPAYRKHKPLRKDVNSFTDELLKCLQTIKLSEERDEHEEHYKEPIKTSENEYTVEFMSPKKQTKEK